MEGVCDAINDLCDFINESGRRYLTSVRKCTPNVYGGEEIGTGKKLSVEFLGKFCKSVDI